jgi:hypothetical protein
MKPSIPFLLLALSVVMLPQPSQGQRIAPSSAFALFRPAPTPPSASPVSFMDSSAPDHRWEGFAIGALVGGMTIAVLANAICNDPDGSGGCFVPTVGGMLVGGTAGGVAGLMVGVLIPKSHSASTH